jgi:DNA-binding LacI/PurR family transcriptional regulator
MIHGVRSPHPTARDVARLAGVSQSLVSRVLRGQTNYAAPNTVRAIQQAAESLNYNPNFLAQHLRLGGSTTVGVLFHRLVAYRAFAPVLAGLEETLRTAGYHLLVTSTNGPADEAAGLRLHRSHQVAGVVVFSNLWRTPATHLVEASAHGMPLVAVNRWLEEDGSGLTPVPGPIPRVLWDNASGARAIAAHLLALGHRRLAFVNNETYVRMSDHVNYVQRCEAFCAAVLSAGGQAYRYELPEMVAGAWRRDGVTAVLSSTDSTAAEVVHALMGEQVGVPRDVSVAGFADTDVSRLMTPRLTTAALPYEESGRLAADLILRLIRGEAVDALTVLPCPMLERESTGPVAGGVPATRRAAVPHQEG